MARGRVLAVVCLASVLVLAGCLATDQGTSQQLQPGATATGDVPTASLETTDRPANGTLEVHVIAVGQANSILVVGPTGETLLYDTGNYEARGRHVRAYLDRQGIDRIDHLVLSHTDADHVGGAGPLVDYYETERDGVGVVHEPGIPASTRAYDEYESAVARHNVTRDLTREGDEIAFAGANVQALGPVVPYLDNGSQNENSIVLSIAHGNATFLLTGDAEDDQEQYLVDRYGETLDSTVVTAPHHGSFSSSSEPFLEATTPQLVTVSSPYDSPHGHPDESTLTRLTARGIPAYWTGVHGTVALVSDGQNVTVKTRRPGPTVPTALRTGNATVPGANGSLVTRETIAVGDDTAGRVAQDDVTPAQQLTLATLRVDPPGHDGDRLAEEYVVLHNAGPTPVNVTGWTLRDSIGHQYTVPETTLAPGENITVHTGSGTDNETHYYWGESGPVWNNGGDVVLVTDDDGYPVVRERY